MKVALIELGPSRPELHEPLGIEMLTGVVHTRFKPEIVQLDVFSASFQELAAEEIDFQKYHLVGLSAKLGSLSRLLDVSYKMRGIRDVGSAYPLLVVGDLLATFAYEQLLIDIPEAIFVMGEGEDTLAGIIHALISAIDRTESPRKSLETRNVPNLVFINDEKQVVHTPRQLVDLGNLAPPDRLFLAEALRTRSQVQLEGSRGCPWGRCSFCSIPSFQGKFWRPFPLNSVVDQLITLSNAGARSPYFTDADFLGEDLNRVMEFASMVIEAKSNRQLAPDLNFYLNLPVSGIVGGKQAGAGKCIEMLNSLKAAGLREVFVGIESGAPHQVKRYKKAATAERNLKALSTLKALGISSDVGFIMFDPFMTLDDLATNIDFLYRARLDAHPSRFTKALRVEPGTTYADTIFPDGNLKNDLNVNNLTYQYEFQDQRVAKIYKLYREWELGHLDVATLIQGAGKGEVESEYDRLTMRTYLGKIRQIDLEYLEALVRSIQGSPNDLSELRGIEVDLKRKLAKMLSAVPRPVQEHAKRLGLNLDQVLSSQSRYMQKYRTLNTYEDPVNNKFLQRT